MTNISFISIYLKAFIQRLVNNGAVVSKNFFSNFLYVNAPWVKVKKYF